MMVDHSNAAQHGDAAFLTRTHHLAVQGHAATKAGYKMNTIKTVAEIIQVLNNIFFKNKQHGTRQGGLKGISKRLNITYNYR